MKENERYRVNKPSVILEDFGDEVVIVNLLSGNYYSVDAVGAEIWTMVQKGANALEITTHLSGKYDGAAVIIKEAVIEFIRRIISENLIIQDAAASAPLPVPDDAGDRARKPFAAPELQKYTDMQELLLLDPIHEVDETGWPNIAGPVLGPTSESKE
jgi:hypothetical protein